MVRKIDPKGGLPPDTWLYMHPEDFRASPSQYTRKCSWCNESWWILKDVFRVCSKCDMGEGK